MPARFLFFARLCLLAALAAPALLLPLRSAHPFALAPALLLPTLAWLAFGLAWLGRGAPLARPWPWLAWGLALLWALAWALSRNEVLLQLSRPLQERWLALAGPRFDGHWPWVERVTLLGVGLLLAWSAGRGGSGGVDPWLRRLGLGLAALWCLSAGLSLRPDAGLQALLLWGSYPLAFAAAWRLCDGPRARRGLAFALLAVGAANALYGVLQALGQDPQPWNRGFGARVMGFLGNPNFLGGHLALLLPLSLALALDGRGEQRTRAWRWLLCGLLFLGLLLTQTRGAWAGAAAGCALVLALAARRMPGLLQRRRGPLLASGLLALALGGLYLGLQPQARERLASLLSLRDVEAGRRAFLMAKAWQLAWEHPALGVGPGNFRIWFPSVQVRGIPPQQLDRQPYVVSEHAHNDLLQMAADSGWPAAALWVLLLAAAFRGLARGLPSGGGLARGGEGLLVLGVLGGLAALAVHGLANFPFLIPVTQASAWALAAAGLRAAHGMSPTEAAPPPPARSRLGALLVPVLAAVLAGLGSRRLVKEQLWWVGEGELGLGRPTAASPVLLRALDFDRREDRLWRLHGRAELDRGMLWNGVGSLREALRLNPYDAETAVRLARALVELQQYEEAEAVLLRVAGYAPNFVDLWEPLAAALFQRQKYAEAVEAYDWMIFFRFNLEAAYANKAAAQASQGLGPQALLTLLAAEQKLPNNGKIQVNLAITYLRLGLKDKARQALDKAVELSPGDPQIPELRERLR